MLPPAHRDAIAASLRRARLLYGVAFAGVALELGLGLHVWRELNPLGPMPGRAAMPWLVGLALAALSHLAAAHFVHRRLRRPEALLGRLNVALAKAELQGAPPPELLTVLAIRASLVADVISWVILQFVTIYGLVGVVVTGALAPLLGLAALSAIGIGLAAPRRARVETLAKELHCLAPQRLAMSP